MFLQRLHVFLFSELLVLTRPVTRNDRSCFQVYRQPIPVRDLALEDLQDGEIRMGGSFRGAFTAGEKGWLRCTPPAGRAFPVAPFCWFFFFSADVCYSLTFLQISVSHTWRFATFPSFIQYKFRYLLGLGFSFGTKHFESYFFLRERD